MGISFCGTLLDADLADGVGFEPTEDLRPRRISSPVHSTALPPIRRCLLGNPSPVLEFPLRRQHVTTGLAPFRQRWTLDMCLKPRVVLLV